MKIGRDEVFSGRVKSKIREHLGKDVRSFTGPFHVSEILNPRESFFQRLGFESPLTDTKLGFFSTGIAFHEFLQKVLGEELSEEEVWLGDDLVGTIDMVGSFFSEIKTSRKWTIPEEPDDHYVEQFATYLAMKDRPAGHIVVIYFVAGRTWAGATPSTLEIVSWKVETTEEERKEIREWATERKEMIKAAVESKDHKELPLCWHFKCGFPRSTGTIKRGDKKTVYLGVCSFYEMCKPEGRYPHALLGGAKGFMTTMKPGSS